MIRKTLLMLSAFALLQGAAFAGEHKSADGKYSANFPGTPTLSSTSIDTPEGIKKNHYAIVETPSGTAYAVTYMDLPPKTSSEKPQDVLIRTRDLFKGPDGVVVADTEITLGVDKIPGREITINKGTAILRGRLILKGNRLYQIMVGAANKEGVATPEATLFLGSFQVNP